MQRKEKEEKARTDGEGMAGGHLEKIARTWSEVGMSPYVATR